MFPLKPRDELVFGISNNSSTPSPNFLVNHHDVDHADLLHNFQFCNPSTSTTTISFSSNTSKKTQSRTATARDQAAEMMNKRDMHRNIERQRRLQMSQLYSSLRSLLPLHHIKGKHSLSDLMHESKDYIKLLQNNVQQLQVRRNKIKKLSISSSSTKISSSNCSKTSTNHVEVNKEQDGIEILISTSSLEFELSRVMKELISSDLNVVTSVSTKINGRFLHKIHVETSDMRLFDQCKLRDRLTDVIN